MRYVSLKTSDVKLIQDGKKTQLLLPVKFSSKLLTENPHWINSVSTQETFDGFPKDLFWFTVIKSSHEAQVVPARSPYFADETIYVKETWNQGFVETESDDHFSQVFIESAEGDYVYKSQFDNQIYMSRWRRSLEMPEAAARLFLKITYLNAKRLYDLTSDELVAEGYPDLDLESFGLTKWNYRFDSKQRAIFNYSKNPWIWVIDFNR